MAEFEETLNTILGNQDAMGQIMALAHSLSGNSGQTEQEHPAASTNDREEGPSTPAGYMAQAPPAGTIPDLSSLLGQIDPSMIKMGMSLIQEYQGQDDRNAVLLAALRPFLKEDRQIKLDRALQIARVTRLIRVALGAIGGKGEEGHV